MDWDKWFHLLVSETVQYSFTNMNQTDKSHTSHAHDIDQGRMLGPPVAASVFAWTLENGLGWPLNYHFVWYLTAFASFAAFCYCVELPPEIVKRKESRNQTTNRVVSHPSQVSSSLTIAALTPPIASPQNGTSLASPPAAKSPSTTNHS